MIGRGEYKIRGNYLDGIEYLFSVQYLDSLCSAADGLVVGSTSVRALNFIWDDLWEQSRASWIFLEPSGFFRTEKAVICWHKSTTGVKIWLNLSLCDICTSLSVYQVKCLVWQMSLWSWATVVKTKCQSLSNFR